MSGSKPQGWVEPIDAVREFLARDHQHHIGGVAHPGEGTDRIDVMDPADGQRISSIAAGTPSDVDAAVQAARTALTSPPWATMSGRDRGHLLWRIAEAIEAHADELAQLETLDQGKPMALSRGADIPGSAETFRYMSGWATKIEGRSFSVGDTGAFHAYSRMEPIGVAGAIVPWNFPLAMAAWKIAPALAAGCTVVLKPAEETSLSTLRLAELAVEAGLPPGVLNVVTGYGEVVGAAIVDHPGIDKVAFTGSTEVGKQIVRGSAANLKRVTLELGGKNPSIVFDDADLGLAIPGAFRGAYANSGQVCTAGSRILVHASVLDQVTEELAVRAQRMVVGPGMDPASKLGPLISRRHLDRVQQYLEDGAEDGATEVTRSAVPDNDGYFCPVTLLTDVAPDNRLFREEIFGPVATLTPFQDEDELAHLVNDTRYGLVAEVWTRDVGRAHRMANRIEAGTVWVNGRTMDIALPFGGFKESGWGQEKGWNGVEAYLRAKTVVIDLAHS